MHETVEETVWPTSKRALWVSLETYGADFYPNPFLRIRILSSSHYDHYSTHPYASKGEIEAWAIATAPALEIQEDSFIWMSSSLAAYIYLGDIHLSLNLLSPSQLGLSKCVNLMQILPLKRAEFVLELFYETKLKEW